MMHLLNPVFCDHQHYWLAGMLTVSLGASVRCQFICSKATTVKAVGFQRSIYRTKNPAGFHFAQLSDCFTGWLQKTS